MLLRSETWVVIVELGLLEIIKGCLFTPEFSYLPYCRSSKFNWDALGMDYPFFRYDFATGSVAGVADAVFLGHYLHMDDLFHLFSRSDFPAVSANWFPGDATRESSYFSYVDCKPPKSELRIHSHIVETGGAFLIQCAASKASLAQWSSDCASVYVEAPDTVPISLGLASGWISSNRSLACEKTDLKMTSAFLFDSLRSLIFDSSETGDYHT